MEPMGKHRLFGFVLCFVVALIVQSTGRRLSRKSAQNDPITLGPKVTRNVVLVFEAFMGLPGC